MEKQTTDKQKTLQKGHFNEDAQGSTQEDNEKRETIRDKRKDIKRDGWMERMHLVCMCVCWCVHLFFGAFCIRKRRDCGFTAVKC